LLCVPHWLSKIMAANAVTNAIKSVRLVQFGVLTANEWRAFGIEIDIPSNRGNVDNSKTPYDPRLGALANGIICETCGEKNDACPGHWGYINLEEPCYNPEYISIVLGILKCICIECYNPRIAENATGNISHLKRKARFLAYKKKAETIKQCSICSASLPGFILDKNIIKMHYGDKAEYVNVTAREACGILMQIKPDTMKLIGFNDGLSENEDFTNMNDTDRIHRHEVRPDGLIFVVLPVLPTCARPWVIKGNERKDDDITDKYNTILKLNCKLKADREGVNIESTQPTKSKKKGGKLSEIDKQKAVDELHINIWSLIDNSKEKGKNNNRKHKGLRERLAGKDGHIQNNVAGKRSDFSARTVIVGGGTMLRSDEVGVPEFIAKKLTTPEHVLEWNIKACEKLLADGKVNTVKRTGFTINVAEVTSNYTKPFIWNGKQGLQIYDIIDRQIKNGDMGIFNRQPTLRVESMQGVKAVILKGELAFRLPLGATRAYNADFDGDEMNLHVAQSQGARVECATVCSNAYNIVSAQHNAPCMGCVQNTLIAMYIITETFDTPEEGVVSTATPTPNYKFVDGTPGYQTMIDLPDFFDACTQSNISFDRISDLAIRASKYYPNYVKVDKAGVLRFTDPIPGKIVASIMFPKNFTWDRETGVNERLPKVMIKHGIILPDSGPLCKKCIGVGAGTTIHPLWKESPQTAADIITEFQFMGTFLIQRIGFSMGISDCIPTTRKDVDDAITQALISCDIINASNKDKDTKEREINGKLNEAMSVAPKLAKTGMNKGNRNSLVIMKKAGAKGSDTNNGQIAGFVGQQNIDGKRVPFMLSGGTRTLPHFFRGDNSPAARGFVKHSYLEGLDFKEVWFHAMGGRRGVIDTALKSVTRDTKILIESKNVTKIVEIGDWIDEKIESDPKKVQRYAEKEMEILEISDTKIPTTNAYGNVTWGEVTHITRHLPGNKLYRITTFGGRRVTVTESKSVLVWNEKEKMFLQTHGSDIKCGDLLPVTMNLRSISKGMIIPDGYVDATKWSMAHHIQNDTILDPIMSIEDVPVSDHRYVYDLTVPSTTNFGLANGLHVVDTADSGYIQKKIVNAINNFKVTHDGTVRDASNVIVQFMYGADGFNAKELMATRGIDYPFFINIHVIVGCLNSEAELDYDEKDLPKVDSKQSLDDVDPGVKRPLRKAEIDMLISFIQAGIPGVQTEVTERVTFNIKTVLRALVSKIELYESVIPKFCRRIKDEFEEAKAKNGYMAGLVASCSIGEPTTQLTLNSVDWNTKVFVKVDKDTTGLAEGGVVYTTIGNFIDTVIDRADVVTHFQENDTEYVDISDMMASVVSVDEDGKMGWYRLEAVTRHLPGEVGGGFGLNSSLSSRPTHNLVTITTSTGRKVTVTKSKSLLVRENNKIVPKYGSEIQVGDRVPIVMRSPTVADPIRFLKVRSTKDGSPKRSFESTKYGSTEHKSEISIPMNRMTGYVFGMCCFGMIESTSADSLALPWGENVDGFLAWYMDIFGDIDGVRIDIKLGSKTTITITNKTLVTFITGSSPNKIPPWSLIAELEFVYGFLDAMLSGDVSSIIDNDIVCTLPNTDLAFGVAELCSRTDTHVKVFKDVNVIIPSKYASNLMSKIGQLTNEYKQVIYETTLMDDKPYVDDIIPGVVVDELNLNGSYHRDNLISYTDFDVVRKAIDSDVIFDEVVSVAEEPSSKKKVYDFTVEITRNFTIFGGLCVRDTFHNAGNSAKDVTLGVPRLKEILNATANPSKTTCTVYIDDDTLSDLHSKRITLAATKDKKELETSSTKIADIDKESLFIISQFAAPLPYLTVNDFLSDIELKYLPTEDGYVRDSSPLGFITYEQYEPKWWVTFREDLGMEPKFNADAWVAILKLNVEKMYEHATTTEDIAKVIEDNSFCTKGYSMACVPSPTNIGEIEVYVNFAEISKIVAEQIVMPDGEHIKRTLIGPDNAEYFTMRDVAVDMIKNVKVQGIQGITKTYYRQEKSTEWVIDTQGTNLMALFGMDNVDTTRTTSDNMWEIYDTLGIEATRAFIIKEITKILSFDGTYINPRHVCLLADGMCRSGSITSVNRDGIPRDVGPIAKGMFEKAVENFAEASCFAEHDEMHGMAAAVMFGTVAEAGTGLVEIKDAEKLPAKRELIKIPTKIRR